MDPVVSLPLPRSPDQPHKLASRWESQAEQSQKKQASVENLLAQSFNTICQELREGMAACPSSNYQRLRSDSLEGMAACPNSNYQRLRSDSFSSGLSSSSRGSTSTAITDLYSGSAPRSPTHIPPYSWSTPN